MFHNITVMRDESFSRIEREYREIPRKATVGEYVKIVESGPLPIDGIYTCEDADYPWGGSAEDRDGTGISADGRPLYHRRYVVLEPTDVVRVQDVRYRLDYREAVVGDIVIATRGDRGYFAKGSVGCVLKVCADKDLYVDFKGFGNTSYKEALDGCWYVHPTKYVVITPLSALEHSVPSTTTLESRIVELETKVARLESAQEKAPEVFKEPTQQQIRDEIVERAKVDVTDLRKFKGTSIPGEILRFWPIGSGAVTHGVEYVVNSDKRTVVALVVVKLGERRVVAKGIAKCAPDDVFNAHIGKAIALRRALGLEVPIEYVTAPRPLKIRKGNMVRWTFDDDPTDVEILTITDLKAPGEYWLSDGEWDYAKRLTVLDDTNSEVAA